MKHLLTALLFSLFSITTWGAARTVSISAPQGKVELTNGSNVTVTYDIQCFDKVDGTTIINLSGQTLAANKGTHHQAAGGCAGGATPSKVLPQGPMFCSGSNTYADRANACDLSTSSVCTIQKLSSLSVNVAEFPYSHWISVDSGGSNNWFSTYDNWSTNNSPQDTTGGKAYAPSTTGKNGNSYKCATGSGGTGQQIGGCQATYATNNQGTACCPNNNGFVSCKVTVTAGTPTAGYLQSPQYKGGSAF